MTITSPGELIASARAEGAAAVAAFNVIGLEHLEAFILAAEEVDAPVILQLSQNAVRFRGGITGIGAAMVAAAHRSRVPIAVQLDHADDMSLIAQAVAIGFSSVMIDASAHAFVDNVRMTRHAVGLARPSGVWVEAELGEIGGKRGAHTPGVRTDPTEAWNFVAATGVDGLAVAVGSSHAMQDQSARLDIDLIESLAAHVHVPLVLHGSSGVPDATLLEACRAGISKVNVGTRFNLVFTRAVKAALAADTGNDPRDYLVHGRDAMRVEAVRLLSLLKSG